MSGHRLDGRAVEVERVARGRYVVRGVGRLQRRGGAPGTAITDGGEEMRLSRTGFLRKRYRATSTDGATLGAYDAPLRFGAGGPVAWRDAQYRLEAAPKVRDERFWLRDAGGVDLIEIAYLGGADRPFRVTVAASAESDQGLVLFALWLAWGSTDTAAATT